MYTTEPNLFAITLMKNIAFIVKVIDKDFNTAHDLFLQFSCSNEGDKRDISLICHYFMGEITFI